MVYCCADLCWGAQAIIDAVVRAVFGRRVWILTKGNRILVGAIALTSTFAFVTAFVYASLAFSEKSFSNMFKTSFLLYASLADTVAADILIAGSLCITLAKSRTGFQTTDTLLNVLIVYIINTSLLTTLCTIACFITYAIWPDWFLYIGIFFSLSHLYFNSLLAALNGRQALRPLLGVQGASSDVVLSNLTFSQHNNYSAKDCMYDNSTGPNRRPVLVTIDHAVEVVTESKSEDPSIPSSQYRSYVN